MIRRFSLAIAVLAIGSVLATSAHAGGTRNTKVSVRFKNIGAQAVVVNATSGLGTSGGTALAQNGSFQTNVKPGAFTAYATGGTNAITKTYPGTAVKSTIYLFVEADNTATTITLAPPF